jgi:hypothetical protein
MQKSMVIVYEDNPVTNGWSSAKIKCLNTTGCKGELKLNILFEEGQAVAAIEDEVTCPICGLVVVLAKHLRLQ